jgi:hypothetical protein
MTSRPLAPQPFFLGLVHAALQRGCPDYDHTLTYRAEDEDEDAGEERDGTSSAQSVERV